MGHGRSGGGGGGGGAAQQADEHKGAHTGAHDIPHICLFTATPENMEEKNQKEEEALLHVH